MASYPCDHYNNGGGVSDGGGDGVCGGGSGGPPLGELKLKVAVEGCCRSALHVMFWLIVLFYYLEFAIGCIGVGFFWQRCQLEIC